MSIKDDVAELDALMTTPQFQEKAQQQTHNDMLLQAQKLIALVMEAHGVEDDSAGLSLSAIREASTGRILSVHLTPVDLVDGEPVPRYVTAQEVKAPDQIDEASNELAERVALEHLSAQDVASH